MTKHVHTPGPWTYSISGNCESEFEIHSDCCQIGTVERWNGDDDKNTMAEAEANALTERLFLPGAFLLVGFLLFVGYPAFTRIASGF